MSAYRSPVVGAAGGLLFFYWLISFVHSMWANEWSPHESWMHAGWSQLVAIGLGTAFGAAVAGALAMIRRKMALLKVQGDEIQGVQCSIGPMPMKSGPPRAKNLDLSGMRLPAGVHLWHEKWLAYANRQKGKAESRAQAYADLVRAILEVLAHDKEFPAGVVNEAPRIGHVEGLDDEQGDLQEKDPATDATWKVDEKNGWAGLLGLLRTGKAGDARQPQKAPHGGHTLLEHSYSVAYSAMALARSWTYEAAVEEWNRSERKRKTYRRIGKKNAAYKFNPNDELVPIIALAHDLGKLQTYQRRADGGWSVSREDHDSLSAQMLMRLPEFWRIPRRERRIALLVVSTYHRDGEMRRHIEHVGYEDRIFALMQILILADKKTGLLEEGVAEDADEEVGEDQVEEDWSPKIWTAFCQLMNEANRIAPRHNAYRIGQKNILGRDKPVVVLNELSLRKELEKKLPRECVRYAQTRTGGDKNGMTQLLLETLDAKGVLMKQFEQHVTKATSAVWYVEFFGRDKERQDAIAKWKYAILIDPTHKFPKLCEMQNADSVPRVKYPSGNRNEAILIGVETPETGFDEEVEFDGDDGNEALDEDQKATSAARRDDGGQSTVFGNSMASAYPDPSEELKKVSAHRGSRTTMKEKLKAQRRAVLSGQGDQVIEELERLTAVDEKLPVEVRVSRAMRELVAVAAQGGVVGAKKAGDSWTMPLIQATKTQEGKILLEENVASKLADSGFDGVSILFEGLEGEEQEVLLEIRLKPRQNQQKAA